MFQARSTITSPGPDMGSEQLAVVLLGDAVVDEGGAVLDDPTGGIADVAEVDHRVLRRRRVDMGEQQRQGASGHAAQADDEDSPRVAHGLFDRKTSTPADQVPRIEMAATSEAGTDRGSADSRHRSARWPTARRPVRESSKAWNATPSV